MSGALALEPASLSRKPSRTERIGVRVSAVTVDEIRAAAELSCRSFQDEMRYIIGRGLDVAKAELEPRRRRGRS